MKEFTQLHSFASLELCNSTASIEDVAASLEEDVSLCEAIESLEKICDSLDKAIFANAGASDEASLVLSPVVMKLSMALRKLCEKGNEIMEERMKHCK